MTAEKNAENKGPGAMERLDRLISALVVFFLGLVGQRENEALAKALTRFVKFGLVGVTNTLVSYCLYTLTLLLLARYQLSWDYVAANMVAFVLSVLWSFYWNNKYVFTAGASEERSLWRTLLKTYLSYAFTGILLTNVLSWLLIDRLGVSKYVSPLLILIISVPVNYLINKNWAFRTRSKKDREA